MITVGDEGLGRSNQPKQFWSKMMDTRTKGLFAGVAVLSLLSIGLLIGVIVLATKDNDNCQDPEIITTTLSPPPLETCVTLECLETAAALMRAINTTVNPCENFYEFSCGGWVRDNPIPGQFNSWNRFNILRDELNDKIVQILSAAANPELPEPLEMGKTYYSSCIEQDSDGTINEADLGTFINQLLARGNVDSLGTLLGIIRREVGANFFISTSVSVDEERSSNHTIYVDQPSLGMSRSYLVADPDHSLIEHYTTLVTNVCNLVFPGTTIDFGALVRFEQELARITTSEENRRNRTELYNPMNLVELSELANNSRLDWTQYFTEVFADSDVSIPGILDGRFIVRDMHYFGNLSDFLTEADSETLTNYLRWRLALTYGPDYSATLRATIFEFTRESTGTQTPPTKEMRCADKTNAFFGMAISYSYVRDVFGGDFEERMNEMITNIRAAFHSILDDVDWFGEEETRAKAKTKLDLIKPFLGFPNWLLNEEHTELNQYYAGLELGAPSTDHFANQRSITAWRITENLKLVEQPRDTERWNTDPTIVNAFYSSTANSITFPAGILQPPFYYSPAPIQALNYGAIGMVIGHEITHGFDDRGRQSDGEGNLIDWWDPGTVAAYTERAQCFVNQYSDYVAEELAGFPGAPIHLKGINTLGENVADNGGLRESFLAYKTYVDRNGREAKLPGLDYTPEQLFFLSFSQIWCGSWTLNGLYNQIQTGVHSPNRFRVRGVIDNSMEFAETWNCPPPSAEQACRIW